MALKEIEPGVRGSEVQLSITVCIARSPLCGEHGNSARLCRVHFCPQLAPVRVCIEVDRVSQVHTIHPVSGCLIHLLRPRSCSQDDDVLCVPTNFRDDLLMVPLDGGPWDLQGLIVCLIHDIRVVCIPPSHLVEESLGLVHVFLSMVVMPIDDDIDARCDGCIHTSDYLVLLI